jgi:hypothetical protein
LAAVVDGHPHPEGQGGFAVADGSVSVGALLVGGDAVAGVELVEGVFGVAFGDGASDGGVGVGERLVGEAGVVVAVAGLQVAPEAASDLVDWPVTELMAAEVGWGPQVLQQLGPPVGVVVVGAWWTGWAGI